MKVLVFQVRLGSELYLSSRNTYYNDSNVLATYISEYLRPSVINYCNKYSYDYRLITECPADLDIEWYHDIRFPDRNIKSTLIRYYHMFQEQYDAVVSLDNDIYIKPDAEPLPFIKGHMGVQTAWIAGKLGNHHLINGGVQMVDQATGMLVKKYFENICNLKIKPPPTFFSDQYYINKFRIKLPQHAYFLDPKWNWLVKERVDQDYNKANFIHYCGGEGRKKLTQDIKNKVFYYSSYVAQIV